MIWDQNSYIFLIQRKIISITEFLKSKKSIENLNEQLDSNDFWLFISYKSINAEFREMSEQIAVSLLRVSYRPIDTNVLSDESGIFSKFTHSLKKQCQFKDNPNKAPPPQEKVLLKDPR